MPIACSSTSGSGSSSSAVSTAKVARFGASSVSTGRDRARTAATRLRGSALCAQGLACASTSRSGLAWQASQHVWNTAFLLSGPSNRSDTAMILKMSAAVPPAVLAFHHVECPFARRCGRQAFLSGQGRHRIGQRRVQACEVFRARDPAAQSSRRWRPAPHRRRISPAARSRSRPAAADTASRPAGATRYTHCGDPSGSDDAPPTVARSSVIVPSRPPTVSA